MMKLLLPVLVAAIAIGFVATGTWAFFSDAQASTDNTFTSGTLDLKVRNGSAGEEWHDGVSTTWTMTNMKPGDETYRWMDLVNAGDVPGSALTIRCANSVVGRAGSQNMDQWLEIESMVFWSKPFDVRAMVPDSNHNGWIDLDDLEANPVTVPWDDGGMHTFQMKVRFHPEAGNQYQGGVLTTTMTFVLNQ